MTRKQLPFNGAIAALCSARLKCLSVGSRQFVNALVLATTDAMLPSGS